GSRRTVPAVASRGVGSTRHGRTTAARSATTSRSSLPADRAGWPGTRSTRFGPGVLLPSTGTAERGTAVTQEEHEFEVVPRYLVEWQGPRIDQVRRCDGERTSSLTRPTEMFRQRDTFTGVVNRWYRRLPTAGRLPGGCTRRDVACAVIERRMHVDA